MCAVCLGAPKEQFASGLSLAARDGGGVETGPATAAGGAIRSRPQYSDHRRQGTLHSIPGGPQVSIKKLGELPLAAICRKCYMSSLLFGLEHFACCVVFLFLAVYSVSHCGSAHTNLPLSSYIET